MNKPRIHSLVKFYNKIGYFIIHVDERVNKISEYQKADSYYFWIERKLNNRLIRLKGKRRK